MNSTTANTRWKAKALRASENRAQTGPRRQSPGTPRARYCAARKNNFNARRTATSLIVVAAGSHNGAASEPVDEGGQSPFCDEGASPPFAIELRRPNEASRRIFGALAGQTALCTLFIVHATAASHRARRWPRFRWRSAGVVEATKRAGEPIRRGREQESGKASPLPASDRSPVVATTPLKGRAPRTQVASYIPPPPHAARRSSGPAESAPRASSQRVT